MKETGESGELFFLRCVQPRLGLRLCGDRRGGGGGGVLGVVRVVRVIGMYRSVRETIGECEKFRGIQVLVASSGAKP